MNLIRPESSQPIPPHAYKVFSGVLFEVWQWEQKMYDGSTTVFEKLKRPDTVVVFPVLPDGKILLSKQEQPCKPPFIGAFGGRVEAGEDILLAVKRELLEESGYEASEFVLWNARQPVSKIEWAVYTFVAKGLRRTKEPELDAGEKIAPFTASLDELCTLVRQKQFSEKEIVPDLYEALIDDEKKKELERLFSVL